MIKNDMKLQESLFAYAENFRDIKSVIDYTNEEFQKLEHPFGELFYNFSYYDIANGLIGNCLFLSEMYQVTGDMKYLLYAHQILKLGINRKGIESIDNPGLWSGLAGVCFVLETLNQNKDMYGDIIESCDQVLKEQIRKKLNEAKLNLSNDNVKMTDFDLMEGLVGITQYILSYKMDHKEYLPLLYDITDYFIELAEYHIENDRKVPNWLIKAENQFLNEEKVKYRLGNFNQGVSHGICGVLIILIKLYKVLKKENIKPAIKVLTEWFYNTKSTWNDCFVWEKKLKWEQLFEEKEIQYSENQLNLSWCYGDLMIVYALSAAAELLNNHNLLLFTNNCLDSYEEANIHMNLISPSICHGYAGTLFSIKKLKIMKNFEVLPTLSNQLLNSLTSSYDAKYKFGFKDVEEYNGKVILMDKYCLLTGSSGIYLTLLFLEQQQIKTKWDALFLLD
ncbi:lanthionine synthetase C family protein [Ureibacillus sp. 179-F W5.1 NHS]|uniref:lanthionine synthetase C family protein n=1 Tax=unclassified Ureibacillus TaxID=2638520 RepID=UPI003119E4A4